MKISVQKITLIGIFTAFSLIIFMVEAQFPVMPIGGMKLGLANIVTMAAMLFVGRKEAGLSLLLRIVLAAGLYGTVVSFAFSLTGGILAYFAMCIAVSRVGENQLWVTSVFGGFFHNIGQLCAAAVISGTWAVFSLLPYLIISGILTGTLNGLILQRLWKSPLRKKITAASGAYLMTAVLFYSQFSQKQAFHKVAFLHFRLVRNR